MSKKTFKQIYYTTAFISIFFLYIVFRLWYVHTVGNETNNWIKTNGIITNSDIVTTEHYTDPENLGFSIRNQLRLRYKYKVNDKGYIGSIISFRAQSNNKQDLLLKQKKYPINKTVYVYYNPENPNQAVLETGSEIRLPIIFTSITLVFILLSYFLWRKSYR